MKYTILDIEGFPTAFYSDDIHSKIPKEAIEITDEQWLECINNQGARKFIGGGLYEYIYTPTEQELTAQKVIEAKQYLSSTDYKMTVDYFATLTDEQQNVLMLKRVEAREFVRLNK